MAMFSHQTRCWWVGGRRRRRRRCDCLVGFQIRRYRVSAAASFIEQVTLVELAGGLVDGGGPDRDDRHLDARPPVRASAASTSALSWPPSVSRSRVCTVVGLSDALDGPAGGRVQPGQAGWVGRPITAGLRWAAAVLRAWCSQRGSSSWPAWPVAVPPAGWVAVQAAARSTMPGVVWVGPRCWSPRQAGQGVGEVPARSGGGGVAEQQQFDVAGPGVQAWGGERLGGQRLGVLDDEDPADGQPALPVGHRGESLARIHHAHPGGLDFLGRRGGGLCQPCWVAGLAGGGGDRFDDGGALPGIGTRHRLHRVHAGGDRNHRLAGGLIQAGGMVGGRVDIDRCPLRAPAAQTKASTAACRSAVRSTSTAAAAWVCSW